MVKQNIRWVDRGSANPQQQRDADREVGFFFSVEMKATSGSSQDVLVTVSTPGSNGPALQLGHLQSALIKTNLTIDFDIFMVYSVYLDGDDTWWNQ